MPIFEYGCHNCGHKFEMLIIGDRKPRCPFGCPTRDLEQLVSTFAMNITSPIGGTHRGRAANMFENFTVRNVKDERGKPIVVNSLKELRAAEKRYNFALAIASDNKIDEAPQNESWAGDITRDYNWKWAKDPKKRNDRAGISVGKLNHKREALA